MQVFKLLEQIDADGSMWTGKLEFWKAGPNSIWNEISLKMVIFHAGLINMSQFQPLKLELSF